MRHQFLTIRFDGKLIQHGKGIRNGSPGEDHSRIGKMHTDKPETELKKRRGHLTTSSSSQGTPETVFRVIARRRLGRSEHHHSVAAPEGNREEAGGQFKEATSYCVKKGRLELKVWFLTASESGDLVSKFTKSGKSCPTLPKARRTLL